jgi:calmodulin
MAAAPEDDPPGYDEAEVREAFNEFDSDGSGNINPDEFRLLCEKLQPGMEEEEMDAALEALDGDGDGEISFDGALTCMVGDNGVYPLPYHSLCCRHSLCRRG